MNCVILTGRITEDPDLKVTTSGKSVLRFTLAVRRERKNEAGQYDADFIKCVAWGHTADYINKYSQ